MAHLAPDYLGIGQILRTTSCVTSNTSSRAKPHFQVIYLTVKER